MGQKEIEIKNTIYESVVELTISENGEGVVAAVYPGNEKHFLETFQVRDAEHFEMVVNEIQKASMKVSEYMTNLLVESIFKLVKKMPKDKKENFVRTHYDSEFKIS